MILTANTINASPSQRGPRRQRGFTLIELAVTVIVLVVVLLLGIPSFQGLINSNRLTSATNEFVAVFQQARMEALRRNVHVQVCPSAAGSDCSGTAWHRTIIRTADGELLRVVELPEVLSITPSTNITGAGITFRPDGFAWVGVAAGAQRLRGRLGICMVTERPNDNARNIVLSGARASVEAPFRSAACAAPNAT